MVVRRWLVIPLCTLVLAALVLFDPLAVMADPPDATLLVTFQSSSTPASAEPLIQSVGARIIELLKPLPMYRVAVAQVDAERVLGALRGRSDVVRAADYEGEQVTQVVPNDALYHTFQWNLRRIGMEQAWDLRPSATDVIVAGSSRKPPWDVACDGRPTEASVGEKTQSPPASAIT